MENFKFLSISELKGKQFFIPNYQRGYKWEKEQVEDLLNDIEEFMNSEPGKVGQSYCIQPLVVGYADAEDTLLQKVKEANSLTNIEEILSRRRMEVIDGQQRLTTIFIILSAIGVNKPDNFLYTLNYETRDQQSDDPDELGSWQFLQKLSVKDAEVANYAKINEDFYHIYKAHETVDEWLRGKDNRFKENFRDALLNKVKFIWYLSSDPNPVQVFRRLNDGKISLTDAELIKALILHCDDETSKTIYERASEWDSFEIQLQDDEFWLFVQNEIKYAKPTRIEWIFDLIRRRDLLNIKKIKEDYLNDLGNDIHKTFRYFDLYIRLKKHDGYELNATAIWSQVKTIMMAVNEWYNDNQLYHYVGYLIHQGVDIFSIYEQWLQPGITKKGFLEYLTIPIVERIAKCHDLSKVYSNKRECLPLLLLHNIEEILEQNRSLLNDQRYGLGAFYKFPFHLYKKEERKGKRNGWEIEHVASNAGDSDEIEDHAFYLESSKLAIRDKELLERIESFDFNGENESDRFTSLKEDIKKHLHEDEWTDDEKNKVWNFTLLDSGTNQEYQNSVFPFKRLFIINKESGFKTVMKFDKSTKKVEIQATEPAVSFIPPITKKIFTKAFKQSPSSLSSWTKQDAKNYLLDIEIKTERYLPPIYKWLRLNLKEEEFITDISELDIETLKKRRFRKDN